MLVVNMTKSKLSNLTQKLTQIALQLDNGQVQNQVGQLSGKGEEVALVQQGNFEWVSPEGEKIALQYVADENGYQPQAAHLPTPPPIPDHIIKAIEYLRTHAVPEHK